METELIIRCFLALFGGPDIKLQRELCQFLGEKKVKELVGDQEWLNELVTTEEPTLFLTEHNSHVPGDKVVRERERRMITGVSRATWNRWERQGLVPPRIKLGDRKSVV